MVGFSLSGLIILIISIAVLLTSAISGVFGMAGGMILMTLLLFLMPVPAAQAIHASIQMVSNGWRCFLWRRHIVWRALPFYFMGVATGFAIVAAVTFVPDKAVALIAMGSLPLLSLLIRNRLKLSIENRYQAYICAMLLTFVQMTAGVVGPLLDVLYNNTALTRQQIVSTKAFTQTSMHILRLVYYGLFIPATASGIAWPAGISALHMALFLGASIAGTSAAALILKRMDDTQFKGITDYLVIFIGSLCLSQGLWLLAFR